MKNLKNIIKDVEVLEIKGRKNRKISKLIFDSRKVVEKSVFFAVRGTQVDGHKYIEKAIKKDAKVIVCEVFPEDFEKKVTYIKVKSSAKALAQMASAYYDYPSTKLKLVGITGTNGKTTTATLLYDLFTELGYKVGLLSTVENKIAGKRVPATHTTPDAVQISKMLDLMMESGCEYVFMEVSSHAIEQERIGGLTFTGGMFTNITHDHLDYHKTFQNYINAKKKFFDNLPKTAFALTNLDDRRGEVMLQNTKALKQTYALKRPADFKAKIVENTLEGLKLELVGTEFFSQMIGEFNAYNLLSVYSTAILLGADKMEVMQALSKLKGAEGRFDYIISKTKKITGIIDYAHTPDALEKVLTTVSKLRGNGNVITVVGCGGDRDKKKRPIMAKIAADNSEQVILTSDNPRTENPETILREMEAGIPPYATNKVATIADRMQAIRIAVRLANPNDIIVVAGKGHEKYQDINGEKFPFDDKKILEKELEISNY